jgi:hypothetical protein
MTKMEYETAVASGLDALAVQNSCREPAALVVVLANQDTQSIVEYGPLMVMNPLPVDMIHGFQMGKVRGQVTPGTATLDQVQNGINYMPPILGWASTK